MPKHKCVKNCRKVNGNSRKKRGLDKHHRSHISIWAQTHLAQHSTWHRKRAQSLNSERAACMSRVVESVAKSVCLFGFRCAFSHEKWKQIKHVNGNGSGTAHKHTHSKRESNRETFHWFWSLFEILIAIFGWPNSIPPISENYKVNISFVWKK